MAIPRRLALLPTAAEATKSSAGTLAADLGGIGARPSTAALAAAATAAAAGGRASECQSLLLRMSRRRGASRREIVSSLLASSPTPQPQLFDLLIRTYTQSRKPREAFEAFSLLLDHRVPVLASASTALLAALSRAGWPHLAEEAYRLVLSSDSEVNAYTLNIMVHSYCKALEFDKVDTVISEMEKRCVFPDVVTHNVLIDARFRAGDVDAAIAALVDSMANKGLKPGIVTYNSVLKRLCEHRRFAKAKEVFRAMDQCRVAPDVRSFNILIGGFCRVGEAEEVVKFYKEMQLRGVTPDEVSFSCLIAWCYSRCVTPDFVEIIRKLRWVLCWIICKDEL